MNLQRREHLRMLNVYWKGSRLQQLNNRKVYAVE